MNTVRVCHKRNDTKKEKVSERERKMFDIKINY